jgi:hypothetical protein
LAVAGLKLSDAAVSVAIALRVGAHAVTPYTCIYGAAVLTNGHHGLSCLKSAGRQNRHASINDIIHRALHSAGVQATLEPVGLCTSSGKRPDGVALSPWARGLPLAWDFTCPDTLAPSHILKSSMAAGGAASSAEAAKRTKYAELSHQFIVTPVSIETLGTWGRDAWLFTELLGKRIAVVTREPRSTAFLRQRISIAIQRGNAVSVLGTHRHMVPQAVD